jgi:hypothetical protein
MRKTLTKDRFVFRRNAKLIVVAERAYGLRTHLLLSALPGFEDRDVSINKTLAIGHHYRRINTTDMWAWPASKKELAKDLRVLMKHRPFLPPGFRIDEQVLFYAKRLDVRLREFIRDVLPICGLQMSHWQDMM